MTYAAQAWFTHTTRDSNDRLERVQKLALKNRLSGIKVLRWKTKQSKYWRTWEPHDESVHINKNQTLDTSTQRTTSQNIVTNKTTVKHIVQNQNQRKCTATAILQTFELNTYYEKTAFIWIEFFLVCRI